MAGSSLGTVMKPGRWLIGDTTARGDERGSYQAGRRKGGCGSCFLHATELSLSCSFVEHAGEDNYAGLVRNANLIGAVTRGRLFQSSLYHIFKEFELSCDRGAVLAGLASYPAPSSRRPQPSSMFSPPSVIERFWELRSH